METSQASVDREVGRLLEVHPATGVPTPAYGGRSLPNVASSAVRALGREPSPAVPLLPPLADDLDPLEGRRAEGPVVVLLVDGLGFEPLRRGSADDGVPHAWRARLRPITSVFPTTTTVALTSLSSAEPPGRHGVVGHRMYLPAFGTVAEILRMSPLGVPAADALAGPEWSPASVSGVPTIFRRGIEGTVLSRDKFAGSAFTRMLYDGADYVGYSTAADFAHRLAELLRRPAPPALIFAYWDELDTVQHLRGPRPEFTAFEAAQVAHILAAARRGLDAGRARRTTVLLTSDHGQVPTDRAHEIAIDAMPEVATLLARPPTGDRRAGFFSARRGEVERLHAALSERLPPGHRILPVRSAVDAGLFGPPPFHPELVERLGDFVVLVPSPASITYRIPGASVRAHASLGVHGGIEPAEFVVPLVTGRLTDLA